MTPPLAFYIHFFINYGHCGCVLTTVQVINPRYTPTTTFETFPFPTGLTPANTGSGIETLDSVQLFQRLQLNTEITQSLLLRQHFN
ncbi:hypothetical protein [Chromatium okenii]|uniref:hypothetical protein n=1 Tax=Chromatium okenii TaxID=61644 RepID=UPI0018D5242D|nr:hypothetical protein [Chromatium okenii]